MGGYRKRRRQLKQHTFGGSDRHSKAMEHRRKSERQTAEHNRALTERNRMLAERRKEQQASADEKSADE